MRLRLKGPQAQAEARDRVESLVECRCSANSEGGSAEWSGGFFGAGSFPYFCLIYLQFYGQWSF